MLLQLVLLKTYIYNTLSLCKDKQVILVSAKLNKTGVLYNQAKLNGFDKMDNKYVFGALAFENLDFSLGVDIAHLNSEHRLVLVGNYPMYISYSLIMIYSSCQPCYLGLEVNHQIQKT